MDFEIRTAIELYAKEIENAYNTDPFWKSDTNKHEVRVEYGKKFAKLIHSTWGQGSVHCFVELANGNIHKAASYKAPQKNGVRGNIKDTKRPLFSQDFYIR